MKKTLCMLALLALLLTACAPVPPPDPPENPTEAPTENPSETPPDSQNPSNLPDSQPEAPAEPWQVDEATLTDDYLISLVIDMEIGLVGDNEFTFHDPTELSNDELYLCFLLLTDYKELEEHLRKGVWQGRETDLFYFTEDYITSRLSRFFKTFHFDITKCFNYDPDANAIVTPLASGFGGGREMKVTEKVLEGNTVTFTTTFHNLGEPDSPPYMTKTYTIEFYDGGYYYLSAVVDDPEEPSSPGWTALEKDGLGLTFSAPLPPGERSPDGRLTYPWSHLAEEVRWITLEEGITDIPEAAFRGFTALEEIRFPDTLRSIGPHAFSGCISYQNNHYNSFPDGLETIGEGAFAHCISLWNVDLPASLTALTSEVFSDCVALRELTLPEGLTTLEDGCLQGCTSLGALSIPTSVTYLGEIPVKVLIFQGEPPQIAQENGAYRLEDYTALYYPEGSTAWAALAAGCQQEHLFWVEGSTAVTWTFDESTGTLTFSGAGALTADELRTNDPYRPYDWTYLEETATALVFEEGITRIPNKAFYGFSSVTSVSLPSTLRSIGNFGLADCAFSELVLPDGLETIDAFAFTFCRQLRQCEIPAGVRAILRYVFQECISMDTLTLHEGVLLLEEDYLRGCDNMHELTIPDGVEFVGPSGASTGLDIITFLGDAPLVFSPRAYAFDTMYYPEDSAAWRETIEKFHQGHPNWLNPVWVEGLPSETK